MRKTHSDRIFELDFLRGAALLLMCLDHLAYDLYCLPFWFPNANTVWIYKLSKIGAEVSFSDWRLGLHYVFATLFLLLAGVGSSLTRHHGKRVLLLGGASLALTVGTVVLTLFSSMNSVILFGVLFAMTSGAALCWLCSRFGPRWDKWVALILGCVIIAVGFGIRWYEAPTAHYFLWEDFFAYAGGTLRYGADWFPFFPCAGVILVGYFLGRVLYARRRSLIPALRGRSDYVFCPIGRHPLWIYLLHQPLTAAVLYLVIRILER